MAFIRMKIQAPRWHPGIVRRQRLLDFLMAHHSQKLLLLSAPAGYGKTTLMLDYARDSQRSVCWYLLDEMDREPTIFLEYLTETIYQRFPQFGAQARSALQDAREASMGLSENLLDLSVAQVVEVLLNELYETISDPLTIVLNDYEAAECDRVNRVMIKLLHYLPNNVQFVILSREMPALDLPQFAARQEVAGLGREAFRFTVQETAEFIRHHCAAELPEREIAALVERSGGWITGIILGARLFDTELIPPFGQPMDETAQLFAYLSKEVLDRQGSDLQEFLLQTSILPWLSASLCDALLQRHDAQEQLALIVSRGLFLDRLNAGEPGAQSDAPVWYRYQDFFRDFLRAQLQARHPERVQALYLRAAHLSEQQNALEDAVAYLLAAGEQERAAQLIAQNRRKLISSRQVDIYRRWLAELPSTLAEQWPDLLLLHAYTACRSGMPEEGLRLAQQAERIARERQDAAVLADSLLEQTNILYWLGRFAEMIPLCHRALDVLDMTIGRDVVHTDPEMGSIVAQIHRGLGVALYHSQEGEAAHQQFQEALTIYRGLRNNAGIAQTCNNLAMLARAQAHDTAAEAYLREVSRITSERSTFGTRREAAMALNELAVLFQTQGRFQAALDALRDARRLAESTGNIYARGYITGTLADVQRDKGETAQAEATYEEASILATQIQEAHLSFWIAQGRAENHIRRGELDLARAYLSAAAQFLPELQHGDLWGTYFRTQAMISRAAGNGPEAISHLRRAEVLLRPGEWRRTWCQVMIRLTLECWCAGLISEASDLAIQFLTQVDPVHASHSILYLFETESQELTPALDLLLKQWNAGQDREQVHSPDAEIIGRGEWLTRYLGGRHATVSATGATDTVIGGPATAEVLRSTSAVAGPPLPVAVHFDVASAVVMGQPSPPPLYHVFALGEPRVYRGNQLVNSWRSSKTLELLLFLIDRASPQRKEVVLEAIWPDTPYQQADVIFRSTVYRLRQAIGPASVVFQHGLYSLEFAYTYDVDSYKAALAEAQRSSAQASPDHAALAYRQAIDLYGGSYCESLYSDWCAPQRDTLRQTYISALAHLAQVEWDGNRLEESAALWQRLLLADNCSEVAHCGLIRYHATRGQRVMAVRQFRRCVAALEELGVEPSTETHILYRQALALETPI